MKMLSLLSALTLGAIALPARAQPGISENDPGESPEPSLRVEGGIQLHSVSVDGSARATAGLYFPVYGGEIGMHAMLPFVGDGLRTYGVTASWRQTILSGWSRLYVEPSIGYNLLGGSRALLEESPTQHLFVVGAAIGIAHNLLPGFSIGGSCGFDFLFQRFPHVNQAELADGVYIVPKLEVVAAVEFP